MPNPGYNIEGIYKEGEVPKTERRNEVGEVAPEVAAFLQEISGMGLGYTLTSTKRGKGHSKYREGSAHTHGHACDIGIRRGDDHGLLKFLFGADFDPNKKVNGEYVRPDLTPQAERLLRQHNIRIADERIGSQPHYHFEAVDSTNAKIIPADADSSFLTSATRGGGKEKNMYFYGGAQGEFKLNAYNTTDQYQEGIIKGNNVDLTAMTEGGDELSGTVTWQPIPAIQNALNMGTEQPGPTIAAAEAAAGAAVVDEVIPVDEAIQTDYNAQFNQIQADIQRQKDDKKTETALSSDDIGLSIGGQEPVSKPIVPEEKDVAIEQEPIEITPGQPDITGDMMKSIEGKDVEGVPVQEEELIEIPSIDIKQIPTPTVEPTEPILPTAEIPDVTTPPVELTPLEELSDEDIEGLSDDAKREYGLLDEVSVSDEEVEEVEVPVVEEVEEGEVEVEVLDANGNIKTITTPAFKSKEEIPEDKEKKDEVITEDEDEDDEQIIVDGELNDDEIIQQVQEEEDSEIIDGQKQNIFKTDGDENALNFVIGDLNNAFVLPQDQIQQSLLGRFLPPDIPVEFEGETKLETYRRTGYWPKDKIVEPVVEPVEEVYVDPTVQQTVEPTVQQIVTDDITPASLLTPEPIVLPMTRTGGFQPQIVQTLPELGYQEPWVSLAGPATTSGLTEAAKLFEQFYLNVEGDPTYDYTKDITLSNAQKNAIYRKTRTLDQAYVDKKQHIARINRINDEKTINTLALRHSGVFNINNGVVTDNGGNIITTKEDWVNAMVQQDAMFGETASNVFDSTKNQFDKHGLEKNQEEVDLIDEAYEYLISSYSNETGNTIKNILNLGIDEKLDFGKYNQEMKLGILKQIDKGLVTYYANEGDLKPGSVLRRLFTGAYHLSSTQNPAAYALDVALSRGEAVGLQKFFTSMSTDDKEDLIHNAKMGILNKNIKIINKAYEKIKIRGDNYDRNATQFANDYGNLADDRRAAQREYNRIREKYGEFSQPDSFGETKYKPFLPYNEWDEVDKTSWKYTTESLPGMEGQRLELEASHGTLSKEREEYNRDIKNLQGRQEDLFANLLWNIEDEKFDDAFEQTKVNKRWSEAIKSRWPGKTGDVLATFTGEYLRLKILQKAMTRVTARVAGYGFAATAVADLTAPLWADKVYEHAPNSINEFNSGYTHTGMLFNIIVGAATGDLFIPSSKDKTGNVIDFSYKSDKTTKIGQLYDNIAPGWAGGHGKYTAYSTSKQFARLLPYTLNIMSAYRGVSGMSKKAAGTRGLWDARSKMAREWGVNKGIGKKIISSLNKDFFASPRMMGTLNMIRVNHKMTLMDNIADGQARGLNKVQAFTYGNFLSLATGLSQSIMPDYMWLNTVSGKNIVNKLLKGLKATGTALPDISTRVATKGILTSAAKNFLKEHLEEQTDLFLQDVVKSMYIADHSWEIADVHMQAEVLSGTTILTLPIGGVSAIRQRNNIRSLVYGKMKADALGVIINGQQEKAVIEQKLKELNNLFLSDDIHLSSKDRIRKKQLENELKLINKNIEDAWDIHKVINAAPKYITDTQVDLLIQKEKLIKEKRKLNEDQDKIFNTKENARIDNAIEEIDKQVEEHGAAKYKKDLYNTLNETITKLAGKFGWKIKEIPLEQGAYEKAVELELQERREHNSKIDKQIAALDTTTKKGRKKADQLEKRKWTDKQTSIDLNGPGFIFYDDINGKHRIIINKAVALDNNNEAVLLHELLHAVLYEAIGLAPNAVKGLSYALKEELLNNEDEYGDTFGYITRRDGLGKGKYDKYQDVVKNLAPDELFNVFVEALAQGDIKVKENFITKLGDKIRRLLREVGINFRISGVNGLVNFLRDYNHEVLSGRTNFSKGMRTIIETGQASRYWGKPLFKASKSTIAAAQEFESKLVARGKIDFWRPDLVLGARSIKHKGRSNIYRDKKLNKDLELSGKTKAIVAENARLRQLILEKGLKRGDKIVADDELQDLLIENNLPAAMALAKFAANNPKIMGLEKGKRVTYDQFLSGFYLELSNLARTYDASVNEFGQYMNTILPARYNQILEAEKTGAIEGAVSFDAVPDIPIDEDTTPDDIHTGPTVDTAERFGIKDKTKPHINKGLKQLKKLRRLQEKIAEKHDEKVVQKIAEITADLESKGMADLDVDLDTGKINVKQAPNLLYKFVAKLFGIDEDKLNPNSKKWLANLRKDESKRWGSNEVRAAQRAVFKHIDVILSTVFNEGHTAAFKSSGMPNVLLRFGYNKSSKKIGNNYPQYKKPNLSAVDLLKFIGVEKVKGKYVFTIDRNTGTKLLAIASMADRNMSLQAINEALEASGDMDAKIKNSIQDGLSNANYSRSIVYIHNQEVINPRLPALGNALGKIDGNWTYANVVDIFLTVFDGVLSKGNIRKFAKDTTSKTGVLMRYQQTKKNIAASGYSIEDYTSLEDYLLKELSEVEGLNYESNIMKLLGIDETQNAAFTPKQVVRGRGHVGNLVLELSKAYSEKLTALDSKSKTYEKKKAALLIEYQNKIRLIQEQHARASQVGDGSFAFEPGTDIWYKTDKKPKPGKISLDQRMQLFNNSLDFAAWVNNFVHPDLQIDVTGSISYGSALQSQKRGDVIDRITNAINKVKGLMWHSQSDRAAEAKAAEDVTIEQVKHYAKRLHDPNDNFNKLDFAMHMLTFGSSMESASRRAAELVGIQDGIIVNGKYTGVPVRYEHGKPHSFLIMELLTIVLKEPESKWDDLMRKPFVDYKVNLITVAFDNSLDLARVKNNMGFGYEGGIENGWEFRLFNDRNMGDSRVGPIRLIDDVINGRDGIVFGEDHHKVSEIFTKSNSEIEVDKKVSSSMQVARSINYSNKPKGITVLDFDDTLATTKSFVKYTAPDGTTGILNAEQYASTYQDLLAEGYTFDFAEFDKIVEGKLAPLFQKALKLQKKFGSRNMFILTARPIAAQKAIYDFLRANGLKIPIKNIATLGNSTAEAKALWIAEKASEGYNDFYFADDALQNVQAVENVLRQLDVKRKIQQAKSSRSIKYDQEFNAILEESSGIEAEKRFSRAKARKRGEDKGKWKFFIPPSAEDFVGLIYSFLGKGKTGEKHMTWFREALLAPLNRAYQELNSAKQAIANDYKQLGKKFSDVRKKLYKKIGNTDFTHNDAIRVYLWNKADFYIPGLSESDKNELVELVENDSELKAYADALGIISKQKEGYVKPSDNWMVEDIRVDLMNATSTVNRKVFFQEFIENSDIIFSEENLNKIEAIYGQNFREALEDMLYRVKNGTNRSFGSNRIVNRFMNWINGSIGVTMHFNTRSSVLQSLSMVNFINWTDNNVIAAAKAFANPRQFWTDFAMIFNSDMLKQRRAGLNIDVNAAEIANHVSNSKKPFQSALNWLLQKGFLPTQMMDSFAIAAGGATFYRNRLNTYLVQGMDENEAKKAAFADFQVIAEETQQSARPDMISQQQASVLGRLILAFQNTPIQYARLMKKAMADLANGRGDVKTNVSKIVYYGAVQNLIFYSLQTALFAMMFGDDEDDEEFLDKKQQRVMNGTLDSLLRGMGVGGAVVSTLKNMVLKFAEEQDKPQWKRDEYAVLMEMLNLSPPIGIKARHIQMAQRTINWNEDAIEQMPWYNLDNPLWESAFLTTQSITNIPLARIQRKVNNLREAANRENAVWQRIAMFLGWSKWNLGIKDSKKTKRKRKRSAKSSAKKRTYAY